MTPAKWRLAGRVEELLAVHVGLTDADLARMLAVDPTELRPVLRVMYRQRRADFCWGFVVASADRGRRAA